MLGHVGKVYRNKYLAMQQSKSGLLSHPYGKCLVDLQRNALSILYKEIAAVCKGKLLTPQGIHESCRQGCHISIGQDKISANVAHIGKIDISLS